MKVVTSITVWNDAVGKRMSVTYSEVDDEGQITSDNNRVDKVINPVNEKAVIKNADSLVEFANEYLNKGATNDNTEI